MESLEKYHTLASLNWKYKELSKKYWCFFCCKIYNSSILTEEDKQGFEEDTYHCHHCLIDSVIFDNSYSEFGFEFDLNLDLLKKLNKEYF